MTAHNTHERIAERLQTLEWQITDARWVLKQAADAMMRRATEATASCEALMKNEPCSLVWTEFAEGDLRKAKEARERLERLIETQRVLKSLTGG